jgi:amino acid adenylation domain-containing protein
MLAALLGVLAAGAAYVPLDPQYPRDRLALMVEDSGISVLLTQERLFAALPGGAAADVVFLDADRERIGAEPDTWPEAPVLAGSAAYVIYTSGSTGRPRGVVVPHGALAGFTAAARGAYGIGPGDRVLQFASIAFDASAEEIWPALLSGARLVLRTEEMLDSAGLFLDACRGAGITVLDLPTAYWHELVAELADTEGAALPDGVRLTIIGGERALPERLRAWRERFGGRVRLVNTYGPTEATVVATLCDLHEPHGEGEGAANPRHVPIGRPLGHARAYVLDARGEPSPVGVPGELHLGGGGLARGYLGDPARTAERFVPDPFGGGAGARLYRTGDRVRWLPDGTLEFIGRTDHQVKVRGFRVEPGEVETVLARQPGVEDAAVVAREDAPGQLRLVAYVVPQPGASPSVAALRAALRAELPPYMVPAAWVTLDALPLTRNGKTDRRALPAPDAVPEERDTGGAAPQSDVERAIAEAWQAVLGVESVGLDDNFFDLGGHSLLLARLRSRLAGRFPREVSIVVLFRYPTVRSLAEHLSGSEPAAAPVEAPDAAEVESRRAAMRRRRELKREAAE